MEVINEEKHRLFKQIWEQYESGIRRLCKYKLNSCHEVVEDVVADVFLFLWIEIDKNAVPLNVHAWLYKVANNLINQKYTEIIKHRKNCISYDDAQNSVHLSVGGDIDDLRLESEMLLMWADEIVEDLPESDRMLMKLIYDEGLSMKEAAERMNSTPAAVKQRHYRLVRKIKQTVKERIEHS